MASSTQRPWVIEVRMPNLGNKWYVIDAHRSEDRAHTKVDLMRKRAIDAVYRVRNIRASDQP